jgi:undecaprenyl-diphosphatase
MRQRLTPRDALLLGLVQGPSELLPVSSSAHVALLADALGGSAAEGDEADLRDSLEVALHAGTALALLLDVRAVAGLGGTPRGGTPRRRVPGIGLAGALATAALALGPPALVGYALERRLERRPDGSRALAAGLALGGLALALADTRPQARALADAGAGDWLALGLAQAAALLPGVSRNGATLTAARLRGFAREDAQALSWRAGLPVIAGAAALKGLRVAGRGVPAGAAPALAAGAGAAFLSTLASAPLARAPRRARALLPFALYRIGVAGLTVAIDGRALRVARRSGSDGRAGHNRSR